MESIDRTAKPLLRSLAGERLRVPPVWLMRQAGRYLPEYRAARAKAGDFLQLCYTPELAAEITLQPVRRFGFDGAIMFADILLIAHALGSEVWFAEGEGPRLSPISGLGDIGRLKHPDDIHETLSPVYRTLQMAGPELPASASLIGFAGAPWTVATYMIAGRGVPNQAPALRFLAEAPNAFARLMDLLTDATSRYLARQAEAGAEVLMIFDSWAGSLPEGSFERWAVDPVRRIVQSIKSRHPRLPVIAYPRGAGERYAGFASSTGADCVGLDETVDSDWAAAALQRDGCVQGNLAPRHLVDGGDRLVAETRRIVRAFAGGPHIFNLGHGITPDADPVNVELMLQAIRGGAS